MNIRRRMVIVSLVCAAFAAFVSATRAQQPPLDPVRLETGARLYASHCATCHGPNGDLTGGVNLRAGQFKRAATDLDLMNTIVQGVPGTAMPATRARQRRSRGARDLPARDERLRRAKSGPR